MRSIYWLDLLKEDEYRDFCLLVGQSSQGEFAAILVPALFAGTVSWILFFDSDQARFQQFAQF